MLDSESTTKATAPQRGEILRAALIVFLLAVFAFLLWHLRGVIVIGFAAVVVAVVLASAARLIHRFLGIPYRWSLALGGLLILAVFSLLILMSWPQLTTQWSELLRQLDASLAYLEEQTGFAVTSSLADLVEEPGRLFGRYWPDIAAVAGTIFSALTGIVLVVVAAAFLAADPTVYRDGLVLLVPPRFHQRARSALDRTGRGLTLWLAGQLISMIIVGALVGLGAWWIGLPSPLALGVIAALFEFLPLIGPFLGAVPGLLLAVTEGWNMLLWALLLYVAVQQLESNLITPYVQKKAVSVPPALFMLSVLAMGSVFGVLGVVLSGPLTVAAFALVRAIYVEDTLGEELSEESAI
jgi:predicted PurR-regulated permease PerM